MEDRKRIAILVGQADEETQSKFISGFLESAFEYDFDVCVFSMYRKYQDSVEREEAESNIFNLPNWKEFDGVLILKDSIQTPNISNETNENRGQKISNSLILNVVRKVSHGVGDLPDVAAAYCASFTRRTERPVWRPALNTPIIFCLVHLDGFRRQRYKNPRKRKTFAETFCVSVWIIP